MEDAPVRVELHCHSNLSDGAVPPERLAAALAEAQVSVAVLTDHDTVEGCARFREALAGAGVASIDGVEITTLSGRREVHLLGYGIDPHHEGLRAALSANGTRVQPGLPGFMDTTMAIGLVHAAGGRAFIAHPLSGSLGRDPLAELLPAFEAAGLDGIEAVYAPYTDEDRRWLADLAAKHHLAVSGGSDFHGPEQIAGPEPGVELTAAQWRSFRDLLPGFRRAV
jgi:predicted metal-dependent phosphoesterase TrpH